MKKMLFVSMLPLALAILAQCTSMPQRWPTYERTTEDRMAVVQQKIGEGLKTAALTPDEAQIFLVKLEDIRKDYLMLRDKRVYRDEWESVLGRLDVLEREIDSALTRPARIGGATIENRLIALQRRIDDGRITGRLTQTEGREFQARLDAIRSDYLRMTEGGRFIRDEDRVEISRRLDLLEIDLNRYQ